MIECDTVTRKWGNSIGVTIPKDVLDKEHIKEDEKIKIIIIKPNQALKKTFGMLKGKWKKSTDEIKSDMKKELYND